MKHKIEEDLIKLSKIFKKGFTVTYNDGEFNQYTNYDKPFIVSYETIIIIKLDNVTYNTVKTLKDNYIIGGWLDSDTNTYYIELNKTFKSLFEAEKFAIKHKQKYLYNIRNGACIEPRDWR